MPSVLFERKINKVFQIFSKICLHNLVFGRVSAVMSGRVGERLSIRVQNDYIAAHSYQSVRLWSNVWIGICYYFVRQRPYDS